MSSPFSFRKGERCSLITGVSLQWLKLWCHQYHPLLEEAVNFLYETSPFTVWTNVSKALRGAVQCATLLTTRFLDVSQLPSILYKIAHIWVGVWHTFHSPI